ncbi:hypothetical protein GE09DRAFT_707736 [Coniochaeta sp. 2T2.1]|nr:hypothetical protein GE09DRAFT_707736 [Coniochaeta sp. 2T2.1]
MAQIMPLAVLAFLYLTTIRILRYNRRDKVAKSYGGTTSRSLVSMTLDEAFAIQRDLAELEFPRIFSASVFFALFKTYGVPSISSLLVATRELADETTASKRAADTGVLLTEVVLNPPESNRTIDGIARINFLHDRYRRAGKISDDDMLYTLSLFALEPGRWVARYDWRCLTDVERCAMGVFWRDLGQAMEIPFDALGAAAGAVDGLTWLEALDAWSGQYEKRGMRPAETNEKVARATLDIALFNVPIWMRGFSLGLVTSLLEPRLRCAMRFQEPGRIHRLVLETVLTMRKLVVRHLCPPRPERLRSLWLTDDPDPQTGKYHALRYVAHPWYVEPNLTGRWGIVAVLLRILRGVLPGDDAKYHPEGYLIPELGPESMRGKGEAEMERTMSALRKSRLARGTVHARPKEVEERRRRKATMLNWYCDWYHPCLH